jgi:hypothetical protein
MNHFRMLCHTLLILAFCFTVADGQPRSASQSPASATGLHTIRGRNCGHARNSAGEIREVPGGGEKRP